MYILPALSSRPELGPICALPDSYARVKFDREADNTFGNARGTRRICIRELVELI